MATGRYQTQTIRIPGGRKTGGVQLPYPLTQGEWDRFVRALLARRHVFVGPAE